jgi:hypothetical protein
MQFSGIPDRGTGNYESLLIQKIREYFKTSFNYLSYKKSPVHR